MFDNNADTFKMVSGAYKKLKSYYFYDKSILFMKKKIATFESDRTNFQLILDQITDNLNVQNIDYFNNLLDELDFKILPKKFKATEINSDVITNYVDRNKEIQRINFFLDLPVQLYIIDTLWLLLIGKIMTDQALMSNFSYAGRFKKSLFKTGDESLVTGIDYDSNRCFLPYFNLYSKWRDSAFDTIKSQHNNNDTVLLGLDLKSFYYTVEFKFDELKTLLGNDDRYESFSFLTEIIESIYLRYTKILREYKQGISKQEGACIFPIGLLSPIVLRELYLSKFDLEIKEKIEPYYYGRYVDDLLIVIKANGMENDNIETFIARFLISTNIAHPGNKDLRFVLHPNLRLQKEKISCFFFGKDKKDLILEIYNEQIRVNSSEINLLPDVGFFKEKFNNHAYYISNLEKSKNLRDLGFMESNNYKASLFINKLLKILSNTFCCEQEYESHLYEIIEFYKGSQSIEFSNIWRSIFELFVICGDKIKRNTFYSNVKMAISSISFDKLDENEIYKKKQPKLLKKIKLNLKEQLDIAFSLAVALDLNFCNTQRHKSLALTFRESNMLNHHMVLEPLINYAYSHDNEISFINNPNCGSNPKLSRLDPFKLFWSPRYIHLNEFYLKSIMSSFNDECYNFKEQIEDSIFKKFIKHNNLPASIKSPILSSPKTIVYQNVNVAIKEIIFESSLSESENDKGIVRIALANLNFNESQCFDYLRHPEKVLTKEYKLRLFDLMNATYKEKATVIVFPEFCIPSPWLNDFANFSMNTGITIISGLQYLKSKKDKSKFEQVFNTVITIKPTKSKLGFRSSMLFFREKNYYAPAEKLELSKRGFTCVDKLIPLYQIIRDGISDFSTILCFEFTDINSRTTLKSKIDTLFVPQFNRDTTYFSSIVDSTSRDLHCFIVQANTSLYGDSRINAPYKTIYKNITQINGGLNDSILVGEINIKELLDFRSNYFNNFNLHNDVCLQCTKFKKINYDSKKCNNCKTIQSIERKIKHKRIKNLPPNF